MEMTIIILTVLLVWVSGFALKLNGRNYDLQKLVERQESEIADISEESSYWKNCSHNMYRKGSKKQKPYDAQDYRVADNCEDE